MLTAKLGFTHNRVVARKTMADFTGGCSLPAVLLGGLQTWAGSLTAHFGFQLQYLPAPKALLWLLCPSVSHTPCESTRLMASPTWISPRKMKDGGCWGGSPVPRREDMLKEIVSFQRALKDAQVWAGISWDPPLDSLERCTKRGGEGWEFGQYLGNVLLFLEIFLCIRQLLTWCWLQVQQLL